MSWAELETITVQARGTEEAVRDIPVAITAISEEQMDKLSVNSLEDITRIAPQLTIVRGGSGSGASIAIRGIFSTNTSIGIEQSVAVILDGVYYPQGRVIDEGLFDVSQVAILKGPQALYFGKNATAGVISITTNDPGPEFEALARVGYEIEQERLMGTAMVSFPVTDKLGIRLAVQGTKMFGGYIRNEAGPTTYTVLDYPTFTPTVLQNGAPTDPDWPGEESLYARLTIKGTPSDRFTYKLKANFSDYQINNTQGTELSDCPALNGMPHMAVPDPGNPGFTMPVPNLLAECNRDWRTGANPIPPVIADSDPILNAFSGQLGEEYRSYGITGDFNLAFDMVDITGIINYHRQRTNWVGDFDGGGATSTFAGEHNTFRNFSSELRAVSTFEGPINAVLGFYYQETHRYFEQDVLFAGAQFSGAADPTREYVAYDKFSETDGETFSVYAELIWDLSDEIQLTGGARYLHETKDSYFEQRYVSPAFAGLFVQGYLPEGGGLAEQKFEDVIPEATLRWEPTDNLTFYVAYKQGFKSGGFSNSGIYSTLTVNQLDDLLFEPESVEGVEGGVKASFFDNTLSVEFEAYYYKFKDLQIDFFNSPTFAFITENAGAAKTDGAEVQFTWVPKDFEGLTIYGSLAYNVSKYIDFIAPCYAGQTPTDGCTIFNPGEVPKQQLGGQLRALAPKWSGALGVDYQRPFGNGMMWGVTTNVVFKDKYRLGSFGNPVDIQSGFATFDAALRIGSEDQMWEFAVIGKNLANKYALVGAGDTPGTGGNTGTALGFVADRTGTPILPRTIEFVFTYRY